MQSHFITPLNIVCLWGRWYQNTGWLRYYSARFNTTSAWPPGFVHDGVSRPYFTRPTAPGGNHDGHYRWAFISRKDADVMFLESLYADHVSWENQAGWRRFGRWINRGKKYITVRVAGFNSYKVMPGCLDHRDCVSGSGNHCVDCSKYYPQWEQCYKQGYWPDLGEL